MIPIKDENPVKNKSYIRLVILLICTLIFLLQTFTDLNYFLIMFYGFKPYSLIHPSNIETFNPLLTMFTSMFLHGGWFHFLGNMLYLWIFADNVEDVLGHKKFTLFYLSSGFFASLAQFITDTSSVTPMSGASGAIAGVLGAYLYLFPKAKILVLVPFFIFFTIRVPAYLLLIFWFFYQFININNDQSNIAWIAHIGGFIYGLLFVIFIKKKLPKKGKSVFLRNKGPWG